MKQNRTLTSAFALFLALCFLAAAGCSKKAADKPAAPESKKPAAAAQSEERKTGSAEKKDNMLAARDTFEQSVALIESDDPAEIKKGMELALKAAELDPEFARPVCAVGTAHRKLGDFQEAFKWYEKALAMDPNYVVCHDNLGYAHYLAGVQAMENADKAAAAEAFGQAEKSFSKALELDETYADAYFNLGQLHNIAYGDKQRALELFTRFVELSKDEVKKDEVKQLIRQLQ